MHQILALHYGSRSAFHLNSSITSKEQKKYKVHYRPPGEFYWNLCLTTASAGGRLDLQGRLEQHVMGRRMIQRSYLQGFSASRCWDVEQIGRGAGWVQSGEVRIGDGGLTATTPVVLGGAQSRNSGRIRFDACGLRPANNSPEPKRNRLVNPMGELPTSPPPTAVLPVVFVDGDQSVDLGTVTVQPSLGVRNLQAVVADRVGLAPHQISASLARPRRARRVPLDEGTDLAAAVAREGSGCYVLAVLRRSRRERRGGRSRRDKKANAAPPPEKTILKRLPPTDLASLAASPAAPVMFGAWDYEAQLQRDWYLMNTAAPDPYFPLAAPELEDPRPSASPCPECEAAAAAIREPAFHWCVRDPVTVGFRSPVGPIERPAKMSPSPPPRMPALLGMKVY